MEALRRLAALHDEASETARLANLLGRSSQLALALVLMSGIALLSSDAWNGRNLSWTVFMIAAAGTVALAYRRAMVEPFDREALKSFSRDLEVILVLAGFCWGAGAFLCLPAAAGAAAAALFGAGAIAVVALVLRELRPVLRFLAPAAAMASFACILRPLAAGSGGAVLILSGAAAVAAALALGTRWSARALTPADLAELRRA
ncbi:MAG TPA: hypothetical protein VG843_05515 [Rhizomicrobium sp.]|jgi:hypothetical protein|nr:hypothetical protein [Rhizomicrobium sp.]